MLERGEGVYVYDTAGKRYIEGLAGLWCTGLGYGNAELVEAAREQMSSASPSRTCSAAAATSRRSRWPRRSRRCRPAPTSKVFFTNSGSEANDTQIKIAWYYNNAMRAPEEEEDHLAPARLPRHDDRRRQPVGPAGVPRRFRPADGAHPAHRLPALLASMPSPARPRRSTPAGSSRSLEAMIEREGPETIAAFIAEPVMGAGGVLMPPKTYFEKVQAVLAKHDIAFIADEVICGFGRTGNWWGSQTFDIQPTTVTMAKAITSAYVPLGAVTVSEPVYQALLEESGKQGVFAHGFTYSGHPLACAVALKTIEIYERIEIVGHVQRMAPIFQLRLKALADHPLVGEARGVGLIGGARAGQGQAHASSASMPSSASAPGRPASPRRRA